MHLVMVTADGRKPYAELVDLQAEDPYKIDIALDKETTSIALPASSTNRPPRLPARLASSAPARSPS